MTHEDMTARVARALHQAEIDYGHTDLEPFDELDESTKGLATAYANAVIPLVREDERRKVRDALLSDEAVEAAGDKLGYRLEVMDFRDTDSDDCESVMVVRWDTEHSVARSVISDALAAIGLGEQEVER